MAYSTKKRAGKYISTSFGGCDTLREEELAELVKRLMKGDCEAVKPIVVGHVKLAVRIASQYCKKPSSEQEMVSTAMEAILDGCYAVLKGKFLVDENITGYLISLIHSRCNRRYCEDHLVRVPVSSLIKAKKEGRIIFLPSFEILRSIPSRHINLYDLRELIFSCCVTARDVTVVKMRELSYNNNEIGKLLGISGMRVGQVLIEVKKRFEEKIKNLGE